MTLKVDFSIFTAIAAILVLPACVSAAELSPQEFMAKHCLECHGPDTQEADLDITKLSIDLADPKVFSTWQKMHDRVDKGEMPPGSDLTKKDTKVFLGALRNLLTGADRKMIDSDGRAVGRRLNRYEYENTIRDLLDAPWLQVKDMLPEDGEMHRFNKVGEALNVSHVQMSRYMQTADNVLRQVIELDSNPPKQINQTFYARDQGGFNGKLAFSEFNRSPERSTFPLIGYDADLETLKNYDEKLEKKGPPSVGDANPEIREKEAMGVVASNYEPIEVGFTSFRAPYSGQYRLTFKSYTFWAHPQNEKTWWRPTRDKTSKGRRSEPVSVYSLTNPRILRKLGAFDAQIEPTTSTIEVELLRSDTIRVDAVRLFRSRPPAFHNPNATPEGQPGVAYQWMKVEGPLNREFPSAGHKLLFGDLKFVRQKGGVIDVVTDNPGRDANKLMANFMRRAYRRPVQAEEIRPFVGLVEAAMKSGSNFKDAMITGYTGVLCSPAFLYLEEEPGELDSFAVASRLSYFLWNSAPDEELRSAAMNKSLSTPQQLDSQVERMINDPKFDRFVSSFLDYWLDLRKAEDTSPDENLYPDYYLDDSLVESAVDESRAFFKQLVLENLSTKNLIDSDFVMINERLANHYEIPDVTGVDIRKVKVPDKNPRGGVLTQAAVLKVTANGTTTSPVVRGAWMMERILGMPPPPPPKNVPAIESDTRGAKTIREQLALHRSLDECNVCHQKIDPVGFALESFDIAGGWRDKYRAIDEKGKPVPGFGKNGQAFKFHGAQRIDASGELPDGMGKFKDIEDLKQRLLIQDRLIARNMVEQLMVYATGTGVHFSDRYEIDRILDKAQAEDFGMRTILHEIVKSPLFLKK